MLKAGIVGCNHIGLRHAGCYAKESLGRLIAVCDIVKERADRAAETYGVKAYYRLKDMLEHEPDLDIVDVATGGIENGSWHYEPAMEAMACGKHVLVEKPLSNDIREAGDMVRYAEKQDVYLGCNLNHYFTPAAEAARTYIAEGHIGEQVYGLHKIGFNGGEELYAKMRTSEPKDYPYFHMKAFLSHPFSVMRYFCGDITHVQTFAHRPSFRKQAGDAMLSVNSIHVRFADGASGYVLCQRGDTIFGLGGWWSFELGGTRGTLCIENCVEKVSYWKANPNHPRIGQHPDPAVTFSGLDQFNDTFGLRLHAFLEDVHNGVPKERLRASGKDALKALEYTFAAIESHQKDGEVVRLNLVTELDH